jgi:hypothetical protein
MSGKISRHAETLAFPLKQRKSKFKLPTGATQCAPDMSAVEAVPRDPDPLTLPLDIQQCSGVDIAQASVMALTARYQTIMDEWEDDVMVDYALPLSINKRSAS